MLLDYYFMPSKAWLYVAECLERPEFFGRGLCGIIRTLRGRGDLHSLTADVMQQMIMHYGVPWGDRVHHSGEPDGPYFAPLTKCVDYARIDFCLLMAEIAATESAKEQGLSL